MTQLIVISDASPLITFLASGNAELLIAAIEAADAKLTVPVEVVEEVFRKADQIELLAGARHELDRMVAADQLSILESDLQGNLALSRAVQHVTRAPNPVTELESKDRGETMALAHAIVAKQSGYSVKLLIEEWRAQERATGLRLSVFDTQSVLRRGAILGMIPNRGAMKELWNSLRPYDLSLVHWSQVRTDLKQRSLYGADDESASGDDG